MTGLLKIYFLMAIVAGFLMTSLLPSSAAAQYTDYTRQLLELQQRIQQNQRQQQRYRPPTNTSRQRGNTNDPNYWKNLQRQQQLRQQRQRQLLQRKQQAERQQLEQWRREQLQKRQRQQLRQQRRAAPRNTRTTRTPVRRPSPRKKAAGYDPKAAAEAWRRRQQQKSRGKTRPRSTGKPTGVTTNRARSAGRGSSTGVKRRGRGGIEAGNTDDIRMRGVVRRKSKPSNPKYCGCRGADILVYGAICHPGKGKTYKVGNFPWTPQCSQGKSLRRR
ncbi:MAG: hypothetical protein GKS01_16200 [Alphaproteobacteria bacterium]|nr:hypothetical protein [Alphaproteobacteria bacterium]